MNSLTTLEYANKYVSTKLNDEAWAESEDFLKEKLLLEATRLIYALQGFKYTPELVEALTAIPDDLQQACCEVAFSLLNTNTENPHIVNQKLNIKSISFGNDSVSYGETSSVTGLNSPIFNDYAQAILNKYIIKGFKYV